MIGTERSLKNLIDYMRGIHKEHRWQLTFLTCGSILYNHWQLHI